MASIYKRGRIWWVHYLVGGKSVSRSLKTCNERVALDRKRKLEALEVIDQLPHPSNTPLESFLDSFCQFLVATRTRKSAKNDISYLRSFFGPCCSMLELGSKVPHKFRKSGQYLPKIPDRLAKRHIGVSRLEQVSTAMIGAFIRERMTEDGIACKTANRIREVLHRMFSYAIEQHEYVCPDRRYRNPVEGIRRVKENAPVIIWLTHMQIDEQLEVLAPHATIHAMVATYIFAGLRREEAIWLTKDDVDTDGQLLRVRAKIIDGKFWQPKTKRNRVVPISGALQVVLDAHLHQADVPWLFPSPARKRWDPDNFSEKLRKINGVHGLNWSCLHFRHTFGSHLAQKGESLYKIAELMGNSPEICRRHYAALIPEKMHDVVEFHDSEKSERVSGIAFSQETNTENLPRCLADRPRLRLAR